MLSCVWQNLSMISPTNVNDPSHESRYADKSWSVDIDLLEMGVNIVDMNHSQVESINMVFGWEAIYSYGEKRKDRKVLEK